MTNAAKPFHLTALAVLLAVSSSSLASAQELDYGSYEKLFGEAVTISATGKPERVSDTPVNMDIITAADIQRSGARDIPTLLHRLAGVDVNHASSDSSEMSVGGLIQSLASRTMVLLNGRQVYFDGFGEVFWQTLPVELDEIRQIEVIKGPQSALYGFNAMEGVINIVTFDPAEDRVNYGRLRLGNHARREGSAAITVPLGERSGLRLTAAAGNADDYGLRPVLATDSGYAQDPSRRTLSGDLSLTLNNGDRLGVELAHTDNTGRFSFANLFLDARMQNNSLKTTYISETPLGRINGTAYITDTAMPWIRSEMLADFKLHDRVMAAQLSDLFKLGTADSFRLGTDIRHQEMTVTSLPAGVLTGDLMAGSLMWEHTFSPEVSLVNAARFDRFQMARSGNGWPGEMYSNSDYDRVITGTSFNSSLIDKVTDVDTLRLSVARGVRLPSLLDLGQVSQYRPAFNASQFQTGPQLWYGNPALKSSPEYAVQLGWERQLQALEARTRVNLTHKEALGLLNHPFVPNGALGSYAQITTQPGRATANGIELGIDHKSAEGWAWGGNYTYERVNEHTDLGFRRVQPINKLNLNGGYHWEQWEADLYATYSSGISDVGYLPGNSISSYQETIKGYWALSPRVGWHATDHLTLELVGENLWPYQDTLRQNMSTSWFVSAKVTY
jgi:iron complex outermembrane receptor protein